MPYTAAAKNAMLDHLASLATHVGLFDADPSKSFTGETIDDIVDLNAHGYANGDVVVITAKTGGTNLKLNQPYFVISSLTNSFQLALTPGGAAVDFGTDVTAGTIIRLVELSGGSPAYARKTNTWNAASAGSLDNSNQPVFDVPAGKSVDWVGFFSALTAGTLYAVDDVTSESFGEQGTYTLQDADLDLNAV